MSKEIIEAEPEAAEMETPASMPDDRQLLLDARQAAALIGIGRTMWLSLSSAGKTPNPVRLGRLVRWRREEIERWIAAGCPSRSTWVLMRKK